MLYLLPVLAGTLLTACKDVEMKPQDPGALTRGLRKETDTSLYGWEESDNPTLPENEYVNLPPKPGNWLKFKAQRFIQHETAIDPDSISVGGDGITRYSLLIRTAGVDNVSFEGVRCATQEWKMYATGRDDGAWSRVPMPVWRRVEPSGLNAIRYTLYKEFVCERDGAVPRNSAAVVTKIKNDNDGLLSKRIP